MKRALDILLKCSNQRAAGRLRTTSCFQKLFFLALGLGFAYSVDYFSNVWVLKKLAFCKADFVSYISFAQYPTKNLTRLIRWSVVFLGSFHLILFTLFEVMMVIVGMIFIIFLFIVYVKLITKGPRWYYIIISIILCIIITVLYYVSNGIDVYNDVSIITC